MDDKPELNKGYIEASKKRGQEILASLSPQAQQVSLMIFKIMKENQK